MHLIAMDLIGKFKESPQGHYFVLIVMDMLTYYTWCIPLCTKDADEVLHAYQLNVYSKFCGYHKILSDSG